MISGVVADRVNRRQIIFVTQIIQIGVASALGFLTVTEAAELWHLYALTAIQAIAFAFELPARQALTPNLVPSEDLPNAFSLQSIAFTIGSISGPALNGIILASLGLHYSYFINAVSFPGLVLCHHSQLGRLNKEFDNAGQKGASLDAIKEGISFIRKQPIILSSMLLDFVATFFSSANALLPLYAQDILKVGEVGYGWLTAAQSIGAAITAVGYVSDPGDPQARQNPSGNGGGLWPGNNCLWAQPQPAASNAQPDDNGCIGHGQHDHSQHHPPINDPRQTTRQNDQHQSDLLHGRPAVRRIRSLVLLLSSSVYPLPSSAAVLAVSLVVGMIARTWPALWNYEGDEYETLAG